ncbi:triose-phosphate transporter family-domain-containing protein [Cadophora sp. MPI-SDFR-AT-0126]|nr:triose-phosphate transporter family-domain-containing protein [Leotiomycetes sp. MPI-SDFR-AT-0126]
MDSVAKRDSQEERIVELKTISPRVSESLNPSHVNTVYTDDDGGNDPKEALLSQDSDIEAQKGQLIEKPASTVPLEYGIPLRTKLFYLGTYLLLNLALTIHSKMLFAQFKFPFLLTAFHTGATSIGCYMLMLSGYIKPSNLSLRDNMIIVAFSMLCTINIAISNVSLALVSVAFHQIVRSLSPVFTVVVYKVWFGREYSRATWISCIPITVGVSMVAYGELDYTAIGFALTLLGVVLAVTKSVVTNRLMTGSLALPPLEILLRISPLAAFQSLVYAMVTGEGAGFKKFVDDGQLTTGWVIALVTNSCIAFVLNISSFQTNKVAGALTITVCGNLKQILTVLLGILIFNVKIGAINGLGMVVAIVGGAYYSKVELNNKQAKKAPPPGS